MSTSIPTSKNIRLALPSDIKRMGSVTVSGCYSSQSFQWLRPHYRQFPLDTLRAIRRTYKDAMMREVNKVLLVIEDIYDPAEAEFCPSVTASEAGEPMSQAGEKVVVGVAMYELPETSKRFGKFQNMKAIEIDIPINNEKRDIDFWHAMTWWKKEQNVKQEHFSKSLYLSLLVVHPAYSRRGHGAAFVDWGMQLAATDDLDIGLIASEYGSALYKRMRFEFVESFNSKGDELSPRGLDGEVLRFSKRVEIANNEPEGIVATLEKHFGRMTI